MGRVLVSARLTYRRSWQFWERGFLPPHQPRCAFSAPLPWAYRERFGSRTKQAIWGKGAGIQHRETEAGRVWAAGVG